MNAFEKIIAEVLELAEPNGNPYIDCADVIEIVNQVAEEYSNDGWIPVSEGLPKYTQDYNVTVGVGNPFGYYETVMTFRFERVGNRDPKWIIPNDNNIYTVLAWRELPAKYRPKGENQ